MEIKRVGVVGCGTMGSGICEVCARSGYGVVFSEVDEDAVKAGHERITRSVERAVERSKMSREDADGLLSRISSTTSLDGLRDCDLVFEAVPEKLELKKAVFAQLDEVLGSEAILATNTSSLPVIDMAVATKRPHRVLGFHFFNPAQVMKLVEVVSTISTAPDVAATAHAVSQRLGKHAVSCTDRAGFIVNALLFPYLNDAVKMLEAHYATADDIDAAMKVGCGYPMGPFELLDVVGLDVSLAIERELYTEFREPGFAPAPLLEHLVTAGYLGRKAGRGFRDHARP